MVDGGALSVVVARLCIHVMDGQAMNPSVRTIYGAEQLADQLVDFGLMK